ncbi:DEAD/DEAH box helicase [Desulfobacterales bacterium HSG16]|nr:DEAD/DEAH box helicase [Desulfobacterales bacterium HSG16]
MKILIKNNLVLSDIPETLKQSLLKRLKLNNPKWMENEKMGRWNRGVAEYLKCYELLDDGQMIIPRGFVRQLIIDCRRENIDYELVDKRRSLDPVNFTFKGSLKPFQQEAVDKMLAKEFGTLNAPTASGKTVMALYMISQRSQPALIVVHTRDLALQWIDRIGKFLEIPEEEVGLVGDGKNRIGEKITVSLVQSLYKRAETIAKDIGYLIVDECHRAPSRTFTEAVSAFDARYMLGLSATPWRRDKLSRLIFWHLGDAHHHIEEAGLVKEGHILKAEVVVRVTEFKPYYDPVRHYTKMLSELTADDERNRMIVSDVAIERESEKGICLILSDRKKHCETLSTLLKYRHKVDSEVMTGDLATARRREIIEKIANGECMVLIATGQLIGEGFDCPDLSTLFIATPIRFAGRLLQYLGRILRPDGSGAKHPRVYDYVDVNVGPLAVAAQARQQVYGRI